MSIETLVRTSAGIGATGTQGEWFWATTVDSKADKVSTIWIHPSGPVWLTELSNGVSKRFAAKSSIASFATRPIDLGTLKIQKATELQWNPVHQNFEVGAIVLGSKDRLLMRGTAPDNSLSTVVALVRSENVQGSVMPTSPGKYQYMWTLSRGPNSEWVESV